MMAFRRSSLQVFCLLTVSLPIPLSAAYAESDAEAMLARAINDYSLAMEETARDQQLSAFAKSEQLFRQVAEALQAEGREPNAELLINLGNSALQAEHLGVSILNYRRALIHSPDSTQARQNLAFARTQVEDWAQYNAEDPLIDTLFFWRQRFSRSSILGVAALSFLLASLLIATSIAFRLSLLRNLALLPVIIWGILLLSLIGNRESRSDGVIIAGEVVLRSANSSNAQEVLSQPLPDGTEVQISERREGWVEVLVAGRSGWVQAREVAVVNPSM
ncbi:MAG: hypothetical protein VXZ82_05630 [Planctomycetota bacterium]|nr:hypothetical protein [Planctomycetota bacterium]